jgi:hypothetical protein
MVKNILTQFSSFVKIFSNFLLKHIISILLFILCFGVGFCMGAKIFSRPAITISGNMIDLNTLMSETNKIKEQNMANIQGFVDDKIQEDIYYVASSRGKNYYPSTCSAWKSLSPDNLIKFNTEDEAKTAGYTLSKQCQ